MFPTANEFTQHFPLSLVQNRAITFLLVLSRKQNSKPKLLSSKSDPTSHYTNPGSSSNAGTSCEKPNSDFQHNDVSKAVHNDANDTSENGTASFSKRHSNDHEVKDETTIGVRDINAEEDTVVQLKNRERNKGSLKRRLRPGRTAMALDLAEGLYSFRKMLDGNNQPTSTLEGEKNETIDDAAGKEDKEISKDDNSYHDAMNIREREGKGGNEENASFENNNINNATKENETDINTKAEDTTKETDVFHDTDGPRDFELDGLTQRMLSGKFGKSASRRFSTSFRYLVVLQNPR